MKQTLLRSEIKYETDIVWARKKARQISIFLNFDNQDQTRISTAVSEIARNAFQYAGGGMVDFVIVQKDQFLSLTLIISDQGKGIQYLNDIENGVYVSPQGMGAGLMGSKRLMDHFEIKTGQNGTTITMEKFITHRKHLLSTQEIKQLTSILSQGSEMSPMGELQKQNSEILHALSELNERKEELDRLNRELEDTNRGVLALYAELDEKAHHLKLASEAKTSFLSNMTHEFRTPLNSILSIASIILAEARKENAHEREKQVNFIIKAAHGLSDLVNDLLDIAKIEAGKIQLKPSLFTINEMFSTLRGLMKPLVNGEKVDLSFESDLDIGLYTDEAKLAQILRNLVSNALKYTEAGKVMVSASLENGNTLCIQVIDTGIGIAHQNLESIFEEFVQIDNPHQSRNKGTGLGLPLCRKLSHLLGGYIKVASDLGQGSTFTIKLPTTLPGFDHGMILQDKSPIAPVDMVNHLTKVLIIDDDDSVRYSIRKNLEDLDMVVIEASNADEGLKLAKEQVPSLIVLDLVMPEKSGIDFLNDRLNEKHLRQIPVMLHTSKDLEPEERKFLEQATAKVIIKNKDFQALRSAIIAQLQK